MTRPPAPGKRRARLPQVAAMAALGVLAAACGGGPTATQPQGGPEQPQATPTQPQGSPAQGITVAVEDSSQYGRVLVDGQGQALYLFTADKKGQSACYDDCADAWPPLTGQPQAGEGAQARYLGTIERDTGKLQVTYRGHPLYHFERDEGADNFTGQDIKSFGGEWYLVSPDGTKAEEKSGGGGGGY